MYTFIHPTKSGGTAVEIYFSKHYSNYIIGCGHNNICNNNNPIIIVRDVKSRFLSMYKYWKNGAIDTQYKRNDEFKQKYKNFSILDFINLLKNDKEQLFFNFTWKQHFEPTSEWIKCDYKKIIIIKYNDDLNDKIQNLIDILGIPNKNIPLLKKNISVNTEIEDCEEIDNFINEYFKKDIELINTINTNPELFKIVI
jgi:hypothetical protein